MDKKFDDKVDNATKWSAITTILRKMISPITNMILARILLPEIFGVVATINIVISFADIFTDAGFQKYLIQHEFDSDKKLYQSANVAFWTNFLLSSLLWFIIFIFKDEIAKIVGSDGYGVHLAIAALSIPLLSFSSIQQAIFKRKFDFKGMFFASFINTLIPLFVTIPIAYHTHSCWSLIIGTLFANLSDAFLLTIKSKWKPALYYNFNEFKEMFGFSFWTLLEKISIWLTLNVDTFILGQTLTKRNLGIYKTSLSTVNQIFNVISVIVIPVLFSALSRLQNDDKSFKQEFNIFQKKFSVILVPMSVGIFVYRNVVTWILLGKKWMDGALFIGLNGFMQVFVILIANFASEVYRAKGMPRISFIVQLLYVFILIPLIYYSSRHSFNFLCIMRNVGLIIFIFMHLLVMKFKFNFRIGEMFLNMKHPFFASIIMGLFGIFIQLFIDSMFLKTFTILLCIVVYFLICLLFEDTRCELFNLKDKIIKTNRKVL